MTVDRTTRPALLFTGAVALAAALLVGPERVRASVPSTPAGFSDPTDIDNPYFPVEPGAVKVYRGKSEGERIHVVDLFLEDTRELPYGGGSVECRIVQETEFEGGTIAEISTNYFAQADDGTVYYFGETVDEYEDGEVVGHGGSWLVGGPSGDDPVETMTVTEPAVFMPGDPEVGDEFRPEDLPDGSVEIGTIRRIGKRKKTPMARFEDVLEVRELHLPDEDQEAKWYAPGVGVVMAKGSGEVLKLEASTLTQDDD